LKKINKTSDGKKGGLFVGKSHAKGGIPAIVVDTGQPIEVEGGEAIINKEATKKYWKELSEINQSAGNGNPIPPPNDFSSDVESFNKGGKISKIAIIEGTKHELEHTDTIKKFIKKGVTEKEVARNIALDHLKENPNYYKVLKKLEIAKSDEIVCRSCGWSWLESQNPVGENLYLCHKCGSDNTKFYAQGGKTEELSLPEQEKIYEEWENLVNMSKSELKKFYDSEEGKTAGLTKEKADELGIDNGRTSARWIMKMKDISYINWTPEMWRWAKKQIGFIKRMSKNRGSLYMPNGKKSRKYLSLLIWGHDPEKFAKGGKTISQTPAPKKDRIFGSDKNSKGTSKDADSAKQIVLSGETIEKIENILREYNRENSDKVDINTAKAVVRRGMGAYSVSHRPTISDGKANSRIAWGLARLKAFLYKAEKGTSKSGKYSQDNDLLSDLGIQHEKFAKGSKIKSKNRGGNCYEIAGRIAMASREELKNMGLPEFQGTPYVVHAQVTGQGDIEGIKYGHAWVEDDLFVYDFSNGRKITFPKELYYILGEVKTVKPVYFKYNFDEARKLMLDSGHYGSWNLITESGL
jgi:rubrerythrin